MLRPPATLHESLSVRPWELDDVSQPPQERRVDVVAHVRRQDREALVALNPEFGDSEFGDSALISRPT
jgi:hypothetical protein